MKQKSRPRRGAALGALASLLLYPVAAFARLVLEGDDRKLHLLHQGAGYEASDRMFLPASGLGDLGHRRAVLAAQEVQHDLLLAALAGLGLLRLGGGLGGLLARDLLLCRCLLLRCGFVCLLGGGFGGFGSFLGLGRALLGAGLLGRGGLLRRGVRALFRNGGGCGFVLCGFGVGLHRFACPFGG